ncbi:MAG: DNA polymerase III subunit alpha, partial [Paludibacteraceae bacterium]|nr:DNA polymerase III subunit alpha [Paludibacteraceae bacterium]
AWDGAKKRYGDQLTEEQRERITFELHIMKTMGFPGYFLIVQDYIRAAREELGVSVGPGRGSAAGSVVAYCLRITDLDPLKYDLLFERFLNPDRISLPDIDVDFDDDGRGRVLDWVTQRYGYDHVAHIITYGKMAAKSAVADVGRVQGVPLFKVNELKKLIPDRQFPDNIKDEKGKSPKVTLKNCYKYIPELTTELNAPDRDENVSSMLKYASLLEDTNRQIGIHACGVIIGADDLTNIAPMCTIEDKETKGRVVVTQYDGHVVESVGLIKMDFLGLKTLSLIKEALANIKLTTGKEIDIDNIPIDDPKTYELYSAGATIGTFQFESAGMQKYLRELKPTKIEDLIAMNALYRPGPMDYIPQFIRRKQGQEPITYDIPVMEKYLKDTYGITVYQEQVMLLSRLLAGFTRGQADSLRKAMGKKILAMLAELKPKFLNGGIERGHDPEILEKIWRDWEKFASYAFNKSHAACYAWVAYQTGYLKANYPSEYMAANLTRNKDDIKEITKFMDECRNMGIKVLGPDVNASHLHFVPDKDGNIRFGLGGIKGVGEGAVEAIVSEREKNGPYKDVYDFFSRVNLTSCNRKTMESLIYSGAFDELDKYKREQYFGTNAKGESGLELLMRYGQAVQSEKGLSANSLFGDFNCEEVEIQKPKIPESPGWSSFQKLKMEKDLIGIYLTGHPLDDYICEMQLCSQTSTTFNALKEKLNENIGLCYTVAGMVSGIKKGMTRSNKPYTAFFLEDYEDKIEFRLFGRQDQLFGNQVSEGYFVMITGEVIDRFAQYHRYDSDRSKVEGDLQVNKIELLSDLKARPKSLYVSVPSDNVSQDLISGMQKFFVEVPDCPPSSLHVRLEDPETRQEVNCVSKRSVYINKALIDYLQLIKSGVEGFDYRVEN